MVTRIEQTIPFEKDSGVPGNCLQAAVASLLELPIAAVPHFVLFDDWFNALSTFATDKGFRIRKQLDREAGPMLAFGKSPRGDFSHAVVWHAGAVVADPHPDQTGLDGEPYEFWALASPEGESDVS